MTSNIKVEEVWESMNLTLKNGGFGNGQSIATKTYVVSGTDDERYACYNAYVEAPEKIQNPYGTGGIPKSSASMVERCGEYSWKVQVEYAVTTTSGGTSSQQRLRGDQVNDMSFDCSVTTKHMVRPYDQKCVFGSPGNEKLNDNEIPIGWNGEKGDKLTASGIDIPMAEIRERYTRVMRYRDVTSTSWKRRMLSCFGKVNDSSFKGWNAGEVLFLGCSYQTPVKEVKNVTVTFDFLIRLNEDVDIAGHRVSKKGHEYVWAVHDTKQDKDKVISPVKYIFRSEVYKKADFKRLGL